MQRPRDGNFIGPSGRENGDEREDGSIISGSSGCAEYLEDAPHVSGQRINVRQAHENGEAESSHGHFKSAVDQALLLRGSRDFASREEYGAFLHGVVKDRNAGRGDRFAEELTAMKNLPDQRVSSCLKIRCRDDPAPTDVVVDPPDLTAFDTLRHLREENRDEESSKPGGSASDGPTAPSSAGTAAAEHRDRDIVRHFYHMRSDEARRQIELVPILFEPGVTLSGAIRPTP